MKVHDGRSQVYIVKTPGNLRIFDQLGEILPKDDDIRKPEKVDADRDGVGGDDGADAFRYGVATRIGAAREPKMPEWKEPNRAQPLIVKDGALVKREKEPRTAQELADWAEARTVRNARKSGMRTIPQERTPRWKW
jgi:hypothetical protein